MIFQEPMSSLNPVFTVGNQIAEAVRLHRRPAGRAARERAVEMLRLVEIPEPERRVDDYPHQLSGGMRQRVMIAMALSCRPRLLIADEPTTALDVTIQAQILDLLAGLQERLGMALLLVTHDLGVVAERADEVAIMYAGRIVERALRADVFAAAAASLHARPAPLDSPRSGRNDSGASTPFPASCPTPARCPPAAASATAARSPCRPAPTSIRRWRSIRPEHRAACIRVETRAEDRAAGGPPP